MENKLPKLPAIKKGISWNDDLKVTAIPMSDEEMTARQSVPISPGFVNNTGRKDSLLLYLPSLAKFQRKKSDSLKDYMKARRVSNIYEEDHLPPIETRMIQPINRPFSPFPKRKAELIINRNLKNFTDTFFAYTAYNKKSVGTIKANIIELSDRIKSDIKRFCGERFRIVVHCAIGEIRQQDVIVASQHLLEETKDVSICVKSVVDNVFIVINMYAVYKE